MARFGAWAIGEGDVPHRMVEDRQFLERHFEDWVERDPTLLGGDVRWVARQLSLPGYRLDLLGLTNDGTWVIAELKAGAVNADTVLQALSYFLAVAPLTNGELIRRIRDRGVVDSSVLPELAELEAEADETVRDYALLVAGVGGGESAEAAAAALSERGLDLGVTVVTFQLLRDDAGRRVLVREVDDDATRTPSSAGEVWSLDALRQRAQEFGVSDAFERIRGDLGDRGYRVYRKKFGLNFNLGSRLQTFWVKPVPGKIHIGYLTANMPATFGIDEAHAEEMLGDNWIALSPEDAHRRIVSWADTLTSYRTDPEPEVQTTADVVQ